MSHTHANRPCHVAQAGAAVAARWCSLPTRTLALLDVLCAALPAHTLLVADFDALPDRVLPGTNAPLVASTVRQAAGSRAFSLFALPRTDFNALPGTNAPLVASTVRQAAGTGVFSLSPAIH